MQYKKGDRVRHPKKPDWGIGQVLADSIDGTVRIFFANAGEKTISLDFVQPEKVSGDAASSARERARRPPRRSSHVYPRPSSRASSSMCPRAAATLWRLPGKRRTSTTC
mgnify:CR=1 FL=1